MPTPEEFQPLWPALREVGKKEKKGQEKARRVYFEQPFFEAKVHSVQGVTVRGSTLGAPRTAVLGSRVGDMWPALTVVGI